jgi:hypothetical protein
MIACEFACNQCNAFDDFSLHLEVLAGLADALAGG